MVKVQAQKSTIYEMGSNLFVDVWNHPFYIKIEGNTNHDGGTGNLEPGIAFSIISKGPDKPLDRRFKGDLVAGPFVIWQEGPLFLS